MLSHKRNYSLNGINPLHQSGVVLMVTLIVLVAMTLAVIALVRSADTTNIIAGNLAFQQAATNSGDLGTEAAVQWLELNNTGTYLHSNHNSAGDQLGYTATRQDPAPGQSWEAFWTVVLSNQSTTLATDAAGNTVSYAIQRMCRFTGAPSAGAGCAVSSAAAVTVGNSEDAGTVVLQYSNQIFYRITSRVAGPRNTVSFVQTIVAM
jgi:type IV pilus assembly protein PilX